MADLFGSLSMATRALDAQSLGLDVTGQNIANVNTPGYARRVVDLASVPAAVAYSAGSGVTVLGVRAIRDRFLEQRVLQEVPAESREAALAESLSIVETALGKSGDSIDARLSEFFGSFSRLADAPTSAVARADVLSKGASLASSFHDMADRLVDTRRAADTSVLSTTQQINEIAARLAALNGTLGSVGVSGGGLQIKDEQSTLVRQLSQLVDVAVIERSGGGVDVTYGNGRALVVGEFAYSAGTAQTASGLLAVLSEGVDVTSEIKGGRLGGALAARDTYVPGYQDRLDALAFEVADEVNTLHAAGFDLLGGTGNDFFAFSTPPVGTTGAARALIVDPTVAADPRLLAAGGVAQAGDNTIATSLANLRDARVIDGGTATFVEGWSRLAYYVGRDTRAALDAQSSRGEIVRQVDALRDQVAGVSLDEEAMFMLKFQRAYQANARFFGAVQESLDVLFAMVRG